MDQLELAFQLNGLSVFKEVRDHSALRLLVDCIARAETAVTRQEQFGAVRAYADLCAELYASEERGDLFGYLLKRVLYADTVLARAAAAGVSGELSPETLQAAKSDLMVLYRAATLPAKKLLQYLAERLKALTPAAIAALPAYRVDRAHADYAGNWGKNIAGFTDFYAANGVGMYARYTAFRYETEIGITPVLSVDPIRLSDLKQYETQRDKILENTLAFLADAPYNNVLLYGDRGTGKSSTVKALLNEYGDKKLRMIEIGRRCITDLDKLIAAVQDIPLKFIIFIDDLTFNENDDNFTILKAVLEGSLSVRPKNVAIYATTNRRHLIKETFSAREGNEVHRGDTLDESLSLSDRFGLTVTFMKPNKDEFLEIVRQIAADRALCIDEQKLYMGAERFALLNSGRSPRLARQYVDQLEARRQLNLD